MKMKGFIREGREEPRRKTEAFRQGAAPNQRDAGHFLTRVFAFLRVSSRPSRTKRFSE
jgi:hypothetical protein